MTKIIMYNIQFLQKAKISMNLLIRNSRSFSENDVKYMGTLKYIARDHKYQIRFLISQQIRKRSFLHRGFVKKFLLPVHD